MATSKNPTSSTLIQGLLEAIRQGKYKDSVLQAAITELSRNPAALKAVDQAVATKPYNDRRVTFYQAPVFDQANRAFMLSSAAYKMLHLMMASMAQTNLVRVDRKLYAEILGLKERQIRNLLSEMIELGAIAVAKPQAGHNPPEYMINPACCGHRSKMPAALVRRFEGLTNGRYCPKVYRYTTGIEMPKNDPGMACGYLQEPQKKEPSTSAKADSSSDKALVAHTYDSPPQPAASSEDDGIPTSLEDVWAFQEEDSNA